MLDAGTDGTPWSDALSAAAILAIDPVGCGGAVLRAGAGPVRDQWLASLRALLPADVAWRRLPLNTADERLLGGLDLAATLRAGRPVAQRGLLAEVDGGILVAAMAERLEAGTAARIAAAMDRGEVVTARDGLHQVHPSRFGLVALDEGAGEEQPPAALVDRLAFHIDLGEVALRDAFDAGADVACDVAAARARLASVSVDEASIEALCAAALALGIDSLRAPWLALRCACAAAALDGRGAVQAADTALAARLVLAPRATRLPPSEAEQQAPDEEAAEPQASPPAEPQAESPESPADTETALDDLVLAAARAAIPAGLLARLQLEQGASRARQRGRSGALQTGGSRGRPVGVRRGPPQRGARLNLIETLRAAAPWQALRRREQPAASGRLQLRSDDFRTTRFRQRVRSTTVFVIDASGSQALHRLAEAKGAVELLLADCYVRRDRVAVLGFRGLGAELLLPPTRSLVRAKRSLAGLPGGGGTPLAAGLDAAAQLADAIRRRGETPLLVLLTDGRANIARDGSPGRARADADAQASARALRAGGFGCLLIDTAPQPQASARALALAMGASYLALPQAQANLLSQAVRTALP
ncbi:magnesium chelatase subunit D [Rivibacter subsaxonicus]|uniref:Protoporphyrin IX magnesium-chelatase n=1 Tax=Rivibacter subsaxonicus TaxID=457575 RepID=A0A4Q7W1F3_9BURK|nr:magnesium chelatase subunit D [Rivibacter subsaxonicus]RZU02843.1 protoporphyrin IX magnesium-chelatase [Rivibacter subsaxonicus]